jgi:hypothetical protein
MAKSPGRNGSKPWRITSFERFRPILRQRTPPIRPNSLCRAPHARPVYASQSAIDSGTEQFPNGGSEGGDEDSSGAGQNQNP